MVLATYLQCSITIVECYNYYYKCTCLMIAPVNNYKCTTTDILTCDIGAVMNLCTFYVVFLFRFDGSVRFLLSHIYRVCDKFEQTENIPHLLRSRWTRTATH